MYDEEGLKIIKNLMDKVVKNNVTIIFFSDFVIGDKFVEDVIVGFVIVEIGIFDGCMVR